MPETTGRPAGGLGGTGRQAEEGEKRPLLAQLLVALLLGLVAFAMTVQMRGTASDDFSNLRQGELVELLNSLDSASDRVNRQLQELTATRNDLLSSTEQSEAAERQAQKRADDLAILAGTVPAVGSGIVITIDDPDGAIDAAVLLDAVSELRDASAEAIQINDGIRVVAHTYFVDTQDGPVADGVVIASPITITAIGAPETMKSAMEFPGSVVERVEDRKAKITIVEREHVSVTAVASERPGQYAQPRTESN